MVEISQPVSRKETQMKKLFGGDDDWDSTPADEQGNNPGNPPA